MSVAEMERIEQIDEIKENIRNRFPDVDWPDPVLEPIFYGRFDKTPVQGKKLIMDAKTGVQWDVVSDRYDLIPHELVVHNLLEACPEEYGKPEFKFRIWKDGACFRTEAFFPDADLDVEIKVGDRVRPRVIAYSSYDRSMYYGIDVGAEQLVCSNGLIIFKSEGRSKRKHLISNVSKDSIESVITDYLTEWSETSGLWMRWAERKLKLDELEEVTVQLPFSEKEREKMMALPLINHNNNESLMTLGSNATLWDVNSAATQMARHEIKSESRSVELEAEIAKVMGGLI